MYEKMMNINIIMKIQYLSKEKPCMCKNINKSCIAFLDLSIKNKYIHYNYSFIQQTLNLNLKRN